MLEYLMSKRLPFSHPHQDCQLTTMLHCSGSFEPRFAEQVSTRVSTNKSKPPVRNQLVASYPQHPSGWTVPIIVKDITRAYTRPLRLPHPTVNMANRLWNSLRPGHPR
ncbi:uncharacterized protein BDV17DRAFT_221143 [Aspergillus undulatus]|uniref:uncharacterized protein n=1 Tax=Aspergillus undulatus TaxID=1810928 RepID=UPI003CCCAECD